MYQNQPPKSVWTWPKGSWQWLWLEAATKKAAVALPEAAAFRVALVVCYVADVWLLCLMASTSAGSWLWWMISHFAAGRECSWKLSAGAATTCRPGFQLHVSPAANRAVLVERKRVALSHLTFRSPPFRPAIWPFDSRQTKQNSNTKQLKKDTNAIIPTLNSIYMPGHTQKAQSKWAEERSTAQQLQK